MSSRFNPYAEWFGLNTSTKPSYYDLLGVPNFETEPPVIAEAAELRLQQLEPHRNGPNAEQAEKLSREVTGVMNLLLSPDKRRQYDEQLRQQLAPPAAPPSLIDAADSPTMMLPPGAYTLPPMNTAPQVPAAPSPYGAYPGYAAPPMAAQGYGAPPQNNFGAPTGFPGAQPMMPQAAPSFAAAPMGYPPAAPPYGAPAAPAGFAPGFPPAAQPAAFAATMPPAAAPAAASITGGSSYSSSNVSQRTRLAGARKQKSSSTMMATAIIGGAGAILGIVMLAVAMGTKSTPTPRAQPTVVAKKPNQMPQDVALTRAEQMVLAMTPLPDTNSFTDGSVYRSTPDEVLRNEARMRDMNSGTVEGFPPIPNLVQSMAPAGVVPSIATPAPMPMASATGTAPNPFTPPKPVPAPPPVPAPAASPTATAAMPAPATPSAPAAVPMIAGLEPTQVAMEAVLPADALREKSVNNMLGAARTRMKARDYAKAEEIILTAQVTADTPALITSSHEHGRVVEHIRVFWTAVREGTKSLKEGDEIIYAGKAAQVVKHDDLAIIVKQNNKDVAIQIDKVLPGLAVMLAERSLPADAASTKIAIASFLASDQGGDHAKAMALLDEAAAMGTDVKNLKAALTDAP